MPEEIAAARAASQSRRGSRVLAEERLPERPPYSRRGSRLDSLSSAIQSATSSPRPQQGRLAQRLLERLENGQAGRSADVEANVRPSEVISKANVRPSEVISRAEPGRRSRGRRAGQGEPSVILEEPSSPNEVPIRDVLYYDQEKGPPKAQASSSGVQSRSVTGTYRQFDTESKPKKEEIKPPPLQLHRAKEEEISESESEKSITISRL